MADDVKLDTSVLDALIAQFPGKVAALVETYGTKIAGDAARLAPVDTSALRNSLLSESKMTGQTEYTVQDGVEYGIFQELGTSKMKAQPFVVPAVEANTKPFIDAFTKLFLEFKAVEK